MARNSAVSGVSGAARVQRLSGPALAAASAHGQRLDLNGKARAIITDAPALTTSGLDLGTLYKRHVEGAFVPKSATKALHLVLQFPTQLVDGEDAKTMLRHAHAFGKATFGDAAIFADRVDRDEKSRHVVDLFLAPRYEKVTKRSSKQAVSTSNHLKELALARKKAPTLRGQGQALQDAWFEYLRDEMGLAVKRGEKKVRPGDDWQTPEQLELERLHELQEGIRAENRKLAERGDELSKSNSRKAAEKRHLDEALAQKKTKIASLLQRRNNLLARLQTLRAG